MITHRPSDARGHVRLDWLDSRHTFSFGEYYDPQWMGFGPLRVINDDIVAPGKGFGMHPHKDMEIITLVLSGAVAHKDSMGNETIIPAGDIQLMRAGTGVRHSEYNPSATEPLHLLQIWIEPRAKDLPPAYAQRAVGLTNKPNQLVPLVTPDGMDESLVIEQDAKIFGASLTAGASLVYDLAPKHNAWLHIATGEFTLNGQIFKASDSAAIHEENRLDLACQQDGVVLLFELEENDV